MGPEVAALSACPFPPEFRDLAAAFLTPRFEARGICDDPFFAANLRVVFRRPIDRFAEDFFTAALRRADFDDATFLRPEFLVPDLFAVAFFRDPFLAGVLRPPFRAAILKLSVD